MDESWRYDCIANAAFPNLYLAPMLMLELCYDVTALAHLRLEVSIIHHA